MDRVFKFFKLLRHKGEPFNLLPWQADYLRQLFGTRRPDGRRQYTRSYLSVAKGNGKTTFTAAICLYLLTADEEPNPNIGIAAATREQASGIFDEVLRLIKTSTSEALKSALHLVPSQKRVEYPRKNGQLKVYSSDRKSIHGLDLSAAVFEELHVIDREFYENFVWSTSKDRKQPLTLMLSTCGWDKSSICYEVDQYAKQILDGKVTDPTFLPVIYQTEPTDPIDSEETWKRGNPSWGTLVNPDTFRRDLEQAKTSAASLAAFRRYRCNCWTQNVTQAFDLERFDKCAVKGYPPELVGREIVLGVDLSGGVDLSALVGVVEHQGLYFVYSWAWVTEEGVRRRNKSNLLSYQTFADNGELTIVEGDIIDYGHIREQIDDIATRHPVKAIVCDRKFNSETAQILMNKGYQVFNFPQLPSYFHEPTRRLEKWIAEGKLRWDGKATLLRWCLGNVHTKVSNNFVHPVRSSDADKIDSAVALIMCASQWPDASLLQPRKSIYEDRGVLTF